MKIATLYASNVKRLKLAEISLDGKSVTISGKNEQGKSSLLDSFLYALGGKKVIPQKVITEGQTKTEIYLNLTEEFRIEKIITGDKIELRVRPLEDQQASYSSPQDICDRLFGDLTFDPLAFDHLKISEQINILKKFLATDKLEDIEQKIALKYSHRTDVNRDFKKNDLALKSMKEPKLNLPIKEISVADLSKQLTELTSKRSEKVKIKDEISRIEIEVNDLKEKIIQLSASLITAEKVLESKKKLFLELPVYDPQIQILQEQIENAETLNLDIRYRMEYARVENAAGDAKVKSDQLTMELEELTKQKIAIFESAKMPVKGLIFGEDGIMLEGIPYEQLSDSRKLLVSMKIGMALNPKLKVMFTKHGNDFDDNRIHELFAMAEVDDYQLIVEKINPVEGIPYVIIEEGLVKESNFVPPAHKLIKTKQSKQEDIL